MSRPRRRINQRPTADLSPEQLAKLPPGSLSPEQYVESFGPPRRIPPGRDRKTQAGPAGGRLDRAVLRDIAKHAHYGHRQGKVWGEGAVPSVPGIAERIGFCERSVQYALRRLVADGFLALEERAGRTHSCRIVRYLAAVPDPPGSGRDASHSPVDATRVDEVVDNPVGGDAGVAPEGATVAPDQEPPTKPIPPEGPLVARKTRSEPASAGAHAPPGAARVGPVEPSSSSATTGAFGSAQPMTAGGGSAGAVAFGREGPRPWLYGPSGVRKRTAGPNRARRRDALRDRVRCPECGADVGENCRRADGSARSSLHRSRQLPDFPAR